MKNLLFVLTSVIIFWSCSHDSNHSPQVDELHQSDAEDAHLETESLTLFSENYEVFTEFDILRKGQKSEFLIHVTNLDNDYSAFTGGTVKVVLNIDGKRQSNNAEQTDIAGIYKLELIHTMNIHADIPVLFYNISTFFYMPYPSLA